MTESLPSTDVADEPVDEEVVDASDEEADLADEGGADQGVADDEIVDELPEDLDAEGLVGPYVFPDNRRRRIPGYLYLLTAVASGAAWAVVDSPYVNRGFLFAAVLLAVVGAYHLIAGWGLQVDEQDALAVSAREVGFPIGHASAQLSWRGLLSRPVWRILLYSTEDPPERRGLVLVDAVDGTVLEHFVEDNPEDWSEYETSTGPRDDG